MDAELPSLIAGSRHNATLLSAPHGNRTPTQGRIIALLYRCVERVHVDVDDFADLLRHGRWFDLPTLYRGYTWFMVAEGGVGGGQIGGSHENR